MPSESQVITQLNDTLKTLNDIGALGIVLITGLVIAIGGVLWVYLNRNRGKGEEAIQQSIAKVTTMLVDQLGETVRQQSIMVADVAKMTAGSINLLSAIHPEVHDTNIVVHKIDKHISQKDGGLAGTLLSIQQAIETNGGYLSSLMTELKTLKTALDSFVEHQSLSPVEVSELRAVITGAGAVIADIKAAQEDLRRATQHTARLATGEHAVTLSDVAGEHAA